MIGNRFLLDVPDKMAVIVHRRYTDEEIARLQKEWLACGERGGVLVSAAIAPKEKDILRKALNLGYSIILLRENGLSPLYQTFHFMAPFLAMAELKRALFCSFGLTKTLDNTFIKCRITSLSNVG